MTYLNDTSNCPLSTNCMTCGSEDDLDVGTFDIGPVGVMCATVCADCVDEAETDPHVFGNLNLVQAVYAAGAHAVHLGIDVDEMARLMEQEAAA